jgi:phosphoglycolate phosphatase-like HAD superfamily hydrolase
MKVFGTDYDGVIINIEPQKAEAFGDLLHRRWGVPKDEAAQFWMQTGGSSRRSKFDYFYTKQYGETLSDSAYQAIEQEFSSILKTQWYPTVHLLPYALELLQYARATFDFTFVSSGIPMQELHDLLTLNGIAHYFDLVVGTNEHYRSKHDHFKEIITQQNPSLMIFIADGLEDMKVARAFGAVSIGIPTNHTTQALLSAGADHVCDLSESIETMEKIVGENQTNKVIKLWNRKTGP